MLFGSPSGPAGFRRGRDPEPVLPAVVLAIEPLAITIRVLRSAVLDQLGQDYVRTLRRRACPGAGSSGSTCCGTRSVRSISLTAVQFRSLLGYTLIVEVIFRWPGLGDAARQRRPQPRLPGRPGARAAAHARRDHRQHPSRISGYAFADPKCACGWRARDPGRDARRRPRRCWPPRRSKPSVAGPADPASRSAAIGAVLVTAFVGARRRSGSCCSSSRASMPPGRRRTSATPLQGPFSPGIPARNGSRTAAIWSPVRWSPSASRASSRSP